MQEEEEQKNENYGRDQYIFNDPKNIIFYPSSLSDAYRRKLPRRTIIRLLGITGACIFCVSLLFAIRNSIFSLKIAPQAKLPKPETTKQFHREDLFGVWYAEEHCSNSKNQFITVKETKTLHSNDSGELLLEITVKGVTDDGRNLDFAANIFSTREWKVNSNRLIERIVAFNSFLKVFTVDGEQQSDQVKDNAVKLVESNYLKGQTEEFIILSLSKNRMKLTSLFSKETKSFFKKFSCSGSDYSKQNNS